MPITGDIHSTIERQRKAACPEAANIRKFRDYIRGRQRGTLTTEQQGVLRSLTGNTFCDNICKKVVTTAADRLELVRYDVPDKSVADFLADFYTMTNLADLSGDVHFATLRDGNHALALSWDNVAGRVLLRRERWWDGKSGVFVAYSEESGKPVYAFKDWVNELGEQRRVIWWPDRIERYIANGSGWLRYYLPEDGNQWPVPWVRSDGSPLGIPLVHFANGSDNDMSYGASELDGGVLGLQDEINDAQRDITAAARLTAYQMLYATGVTADKDAVGNYMPLKVGPGQIFMNENPAARYGSISAGDISQLIKSLEVKLQTVARISDTPLHVITGGDWPSGEALLRAEQPLVSKIQRLAKTVGPAWASVAHQATKLANVFGRSGLNEDVLTTAVFAPVERRDALTLAQVASTTAPFVSGQETLRSLGYNPDAIERILKERETERKAAQPPPVINQLPAPAANPAQPQQIAV